MYRVIAKFVTITVHYKDATKRPYPPKQQGHCASSSARRGGGSLSIKESIAYDRIMDRQSQQQPWKARIFDILIRLWKFARADFRGGI